MALSSGAVIPGEKASANSDVVHTLNCLHINPWVILPYFKHLPWGSSLKLFMNNPFIVSSFSQIWY